MKHSSIHAKTLGCFSLEREHGTMQKCRVGWAQALIFQIASLLFPPTQNPPSDRRLPRYLGFPSVWREQLNSSVHQKEDVTKRVCNIERNGYFTCEISTSPMRQNIYFQIWIMPWKHDQTLASLCFCFCFRTYETQGSWEHGSWCFLYIGGPQRPANPKDIKDDNLLGIPLHFLIATRGVMDSGVDRSTGRVCWGPSVGSCSVYAPPQEWKASVSRAILFSERRSASYWWRRCRGERRWCSPHLLFITRSSDKTCRQNLKWQERTLTREGLQFGNSTLSALMRQI